MATAPGLAFLDWLIRLAPGTGVLRDGQKWVALAMPGYALAAAAAVVTLRRWLPSALAAAGCCVVVLAALPDLLWGVGGQLRSVHYPAGWYAVAAQINADPRPVAVLPTDVIRQFGWAGSAPVLDPLPRWVSADVLATGDLAINGRTVPGEGTRARTIQQMLLHNASAAELIRAGVGWVVVEGHAPALSLPISHRDNDIALYWVGGATAPAAHRGLLIAAHLVWLGLLVSALAAMMFGAVRRTRDARRSEPGTDARAALTRNNPADETSLAHRFGDREHRRSTLRPGEFGRTQLRLHPQLLAQHTIGQ